MANHDNINSMSAALDDKDVVHDCNRNYIEETRTTDEYSEHSPHIMIDNIDEKSDTIDVTVVASKTPDEMNVELDDTCGSTPHDYSKNNDNVYEDLRFIDEFQENFEDNTSDEELNSGLQSQRQRQLADLELTLRERRQPMTSYSGNCNATPIPSTFPVSNCYDKLLMCFDGRLFYEVVNLAQHTTDGEQQYYIHYIGWGHEWDEWMNESRVLPITYENISAHLGFIDWKLNNSVRERYPVIGKLLHKHNDEVLLPKLKFRVGERVLCFDGKLFFEAVCRSVSRNNSGGSYFIHYEGFTKLFDQWIPENRLLKITPKNIDTHRALIASLIGANNDEKNQLYYKSLYCNVITELKRNSEKFVNFSNLLTGLIENVVQHDSANENGISDIVNTRECDLNDVKKVEKVNDDVVFTSDEPSLNSDDYRSQYIRQLERTNSCLRQLICAKSQINELLIINNNCCVKRNDSMRSKRKNNFYKIIIVLFALFVTVFYYIDYVYGVIFCELTEGKK